MSSEPENLNDFDAIDCGLAALMLGIVPAIIHFVFCGGMETLVTTGIMGVVGFFAAVAVWALAAITRSRVVGILVNWAGCILTPVYIAVAVYLWVYGSPQSADEPPAAPPAPEVQVQDSGNR